MANTDESADTSVLGKRDRNVELASEQAISKNGHSANGSREEENGDDSDDDVGPMPMPEESNGKNARKKRKGE